LEGIGGQEGAVRVVLEAVTAVNAPTAATATVHAASMEGAERVRV